MAEAPRRQVSLEQRRRELTETAVRVMARDGAWALTTRAVAKEAGVPHGSVHYAFSSKDALLREVLRLDLSHLSDLAEAQRRRPLDGPEDARAALAEVFAGYAEAVIADPDTEAAYFELSLLSVRDPRLRPLAARSHRDYRAVMSRLLRMLAERSGLTWGEGGAPGGLEAVELVAEHALGALFGAASNWLEHRDDALFRAVVADTAALLAARLRPPGDGAPSPAGAPVRAE